MTETNHKREYQRPEGKLIETAARLKGLHATEAGQAAGISDARWRQIVNGYASAGAGREPMPVRGPADTLARMAQAVGVTGDQLRAAEREDAAEVLERMALIRLDDAWRDSGSIAERLARLRDEIDRLIQDVQAGRHR